MLRNGAILSGIFLLTFTAQSASAIFTYDLRFATTGNPIGATISSNLKTATFDPVNRAPALGIYTLELWGRITGDTNLTNDSWTYGLVSLGSHAAGAGNALAGGGIAQGTLTGLFEQSSRPGYRNDFTKDGIADWGSNITSGPNAALNWMGWQNNSVNPNNPPGFIPKSTIPGLSQPVPGDPNSWEALLATFSVNVNSLVAQNTQDHQTIFRLEDIPDLIKDGEVIYISGLVYFPDGTTTPTYVGSTGTGVVFDLVAVPEPSSLAFLATAGDGASLTIEEPAQK